MEKPTGGWKANAYIIFDYQDETNFKFAGIDASRDKIQLGHRTAEGWIIDAETPSQIKPGIYYNVLVAANGTNVTVRVDGTEYFSHTYEARVDDDGWVYGLNEGMIGLGSNNSRGAFDNIVVQVLPPEYTFEATEDFADADVAFLTVSQSGDWQITGGRYDGAPAGSDRAISLVDLETGLRANSVLDVETIANTDATTGIVFDYYGSDDFKYAGLSATGDTLVIGHLKSGKWIVDASTDFDIESGVDYELALSLKGTTVDVSLKVAGAENWQTKLGHLFNGVVVDGAFGLLAKEGTASFDTLTVKTNDPAFETDDASAMTAATSQIDPTEAVGDLTYDDLDTIIAASINRWTGSTLFDEAMLARLDGVTFLIADLEGDALALAVDDTVIIDVDAAGHGWFIDDTPYQDSEFIPQNSDEVLTANASSDAYGDMDLLTVVMHELGHVFGYQDMDPETNDAEIMNEALDEGVRYLPEDTFTDQAQNDADSLISMDLTLDENTADQALDSLVNANPWLTQYLVDGAREDSDPNGDIAVVIDDEETADPGRGNGKKS